MSTSVQCVAIEAEKKHRWTKGRTNSACSHFPAAVCAVSTAWRDPQFRSTTSQWPQIISLITLHFIREYTHRKKEGQHERERERNLRVPDTKSPSQHKAFPSLQSSLLLGDFRGFAKAVHFAEQVFSFGCWRFCWKQPHRLHCADWGTVQIVHSKVRRGGRGRIVVWASFYPGSMAQRKGWLVCPISKRCHVFGYRDKSSASRRREQPLSREKRKQNSPST